MTLFGGHSYDGVSAAIGVQHTKVANLGVSCYDKALYILSLKLITTHTLSCNFNNTIELC